MEQAPVGAKLPHQSFTVQATTLQGAVMFLLHYYFPDIDTNVFIAWFMVASCIVRFFSKDKIVWYGGQSEPSNNSAEHS